MKIDTMYKNKSGQSTEYTIILKIIKRLNALTVQYSINTENRSLVLHNLFKRDSIFYKAFILLNKMKGR